MQPSPPNERSARSGLPGPGAAFLSGVVCASIAAIPAALRVEASGAVWLALSGAGALVLGPALAGIERARPVTGALFSTLIGLGLSALPLALFAAKLKEATHHRPLGAVTFAIAATLVVCGAIVFAFRVVAWTLPSERHPSGARVRAGLLLAALAGPALLTGFALSASGARPFVLDVVLAVTAAFVVCIVRWPAALAGVASRAGLPVWVAVVGSGILVGLSDVGSAARLASPALFAPFGWFAY